MSDDAIRLRASRKTAKERMESMCERIKSLEEEKERTKSLKDEILSLKEEIQEEKSSTREKAKNFKDEISSIKKELQEEISSSREIIQNVEQKVIEMKESSEATLGPFRYYKRLLEDSELVKNLLSSIKNLIAAQKNLNCQKDITTVGKNTDCMIGGSPSSFTHSNFDYNNLHAIDLHEYMVKMENSVEQFVDNKQKMLLPEPIEESHTEDQKMIKPICIHINEAGRTSN